MGFPARQARRYLIFKMNTLKPFFILSECKWKNPSTIVKLLAIL